MLSLSKHEDIKDAMRRVVVTGLGIVSSIGNNADEVTEITGSESFVHLNREQSNWVAVLQGIHEYPPGYLLDAALDPNNVFVFDAADRLVAAPVAFSSELRSGSREANASNKNLAM